MLDTVTDGDTLLETVIVTDVVTVRVGVRLPVGVQVLVGVGFVTVWYLYKTRRTFTKAKPVHKQEMKEHTT